MTRIPGHGLLIVLLSSTTWVSGQGTFQKLFPNIGNSLGNTFHRSANGDQTFTAWALDQYEVSDVDIALLSLNAQGDTLWTKAYARPYDDRSYSLLATTDGGYLIIGATDSSEAINSPQYGYLIRTDAWGDTTWTRAYGSSGLIAVECNDGGFMVVGPSSGLYLLRTDDQGSVMWSKLYDRRLPPFYDSQVSARCVAKLADDNYVVGGNHSTGGILLSKIDPTGALLWTRITYGNGDIYLSHLESTSDGGLLLLGQVSLGLNNEDYLLVKLDSLGNTSWAKAYGGIAGDWPYSVLLTSDGGFAMTGVTHQSDSMSSDVCFLKTDGLGEVQFSRTFGDTEWDAGRGIVEAEDGGYLIIGWSQSFGFNQSMYLIKTDSTGASDCHQDSVTTIVTDIDLVWQDLELDTFPSNTVEYSAACSIRSGATVLAVCPVGVNEQPAIDLPIEVFPNPAHDRFTVALASEHLGSEIEIFNAQGKKVYQTRVDRPEMVIDRVPYPSGIYLIKVTTVDGAAVQRIIFD